MSEFIKVVICDDHTIFRQGIRAALSQTPDIEIIGEAENGMRLLQLLKHTTPDIVLLDINMPVMDGFATLPNIKKLYPDIKVIVLSWNNDLTWVTSMINLGASTYLTKDDDAENIIEAIRTCAVKEFYMNPLTEKGIRKNIQSAPQAEPPVTKFEQGVPEEEESDEDQPRTPVWRSLGRAVLYAVIALAVIGAVYYLYRTLTGNMEDISKISLPGIG
jgi:DNA-binding NarL/FixJ family response regulator